MVRWRGERRSSNVEDRRGRRAGLGGMPIPIKMGGGLGFLVVIGLFLLMGGDLGSLFTAAPEDGSVETSQPRPREENDEALQFMQVILASTEDVWGEIYRRNGTRYPQPTLVVFDDAVRSACGFNTAATGPFYCPGDQKLYLDMDFFRQLARMGGAGDFAAAYVVGHEVGHHVQQTTGISDRVRRVQNRAGSQVDVNALQVLMELQADCLAGVWAYHANRQQSLLEPGDVEEGLSAAEAIGDDRLLKRAGRRIAPESFTHGTSAQRRQWLLAGLRSGDPNGCDTFADAGVEL